MRTECPVCEDREFELLRNGTPYVECVKCGLWYQQTLPEKIYEGAHEKRGDTMSFDERSVNFQIALQLYDRFFKKEQQATALDIGAKYPWLMHCLSMVSEGRIETWAVDGIKEIEGFCEDQKLQVKGVMCDFETTKTYPWNDLKFDLITMVHIIEHFYDPVATMSKVFHLLKENGKVFVRCPSSDVFGIERDFTEGHYTIHPQIFNKKSLTYLAKSLGFSILMENELVPGQRDLILTNGVQ
jgi:2-polyprenyl-3-methyl-5-hydroxy-6-metoxy-1,4-benzoquinol methylase